MGISPSTDEQRLEAKRLIRRVRRKIKRLKRGGRRVHLIWDLDHVLISGRSDDVFAKLGFNVDRYFEYEERLIAERLETGPWFGLAKDCGERHGPDSQDIVTARSSFLQLRAHYFLLDFRIPVRWLLGVGHQDKSGSYEIILKSFARDENTHVIMVDDGARHVASFNRTAAELGMGDRCHGVLAPQLRNYDEAEIDREIAAVLSPDLAAPTLLWVTPRECGGSAPTLGRYVTAVPDGREYLRELFGTGSMRADQTAIVNQHRDVLEPWARRIWPDRELTDDLLFFLYDTTRQPR